MASIDSPVYIHLEHRSEEDDVPFEVTQTRLADGNGYCLSLTHKRRTVTFFFQTAADLYPLVELVERAVSLVTGDEVRFEIPVGDVA